MRRLGTMVLVMFLLAAGRAEAVTVKDIIDLARAGLGEEVLLALIEVDGGVFSIDKATLTNLKAAGVSDRVIEALIRSGRTRPIEALPPAPVVYPEPPPPQVVVIEHERPVVQQIAVPVYIPVPSRSRTRSHALQHPFDPSPGFGVPLPIVPRERVKRAEPVYWGWGGKLRPDAWKPPQEIKPDSKK
jgi:hypothetical protein